MRGQTLRPWQGGSPPTNCHPQKCPALLALGVCGLLTAALTGAALKDRIGHSDISLSTRYLLAARLGATPPLGDTSRVLF